MKIKQGFVLYLASLGILLFWLALAWLNPSFIQPLANSLSDNLYRFNLHTAPQELVFIEVENTSVRKFGRWPWQRHIIAEGLDKLEQAEVIGLDMLFSEATDADNDQRLAASIEPLPVVGGLFLNGPIHSQLDDDAWGALASSSLFNFDHPHIFRSQYLEISIPEIRDVTPMLAALNIAPDADQLFRRYPMAFRVSDLVIPNLSTQMWRFVMQQDLQWQADKKIASFNETALPIDKHGRILLNFYPTASWQRIAFADLFNKSWDPQQLQGKWVIVGISEAGVSDLRSTPLGQLDGPLMHLTMLGNLLDGSLLTVLSPKHLGMLLLANLVLIWLFWQLKSPLVRLVLGGVQALALAVIAVVAYQRFYLWIDIFYPIMALLSWFILGETWLFLRNHAENAYLKNAFGSYVAPSLVDKIVEKGEEALGVGGKKQILTALFTDLRDFTPTTENLETTELVTHLNEYFALMIDTLHLHQGTLDKLMGDAVMALFNAPLDDPKHADNAVLSAMDMMRALEKFNQAFAGKPYHQLRMGIGVNTGEAIVGNIGSKDRFNYTAIGDCVNTAARLENATKEAKVADPAQAFKVDILIGDASYQLLSPYLKERCVAVQDLQLKGKSGDIKAWTIDWKTDFTQT